MNQNAESVDAALLKRIRAEYAEMPGMSLTLNQVVRLCGIERATCKDVLDALVAAKFLSVTASGTYARVTEEMSRSPMAKAQLYDYVPRRVSRRAS